MLGLGAQNGIIQRDFLGACIASQNVEAALELLEALVPEWQRAKV